MIYKNNETIDKEFDEEFSPTKIWVVPSDDNVKTIDDIKSFIHALRAQDREAMREWAEGSKIKDKGKVCLTYADGSDAEIEVDSDRAVFYNQAIQDLLAHLDTLK